MVLIKRSAVNRGSPCIAAHTALTTHAAGTPVLPRASSRHAADRPL